MARRRICRKSAVIALLLLAFALPLLLLSLEVFTLEVKFPKGRELSIWESYQVVVLAHRAGMNRVAAIGAQNGGMVDVFTAWVIDGRKSSRDVLTIGSETRTSGFQKHSDSLTQGDFWTYGKLGTEYWASFTYQERDLKIRFSLKTDLTLVDRLLPKLATRQVQFSTPEIRTRVSGMSFSEPLWVWFDTGGLWISFKTKDAGCWDLVQFKIDGENVTIIAASEMCACG